VEGGAVFGVQEIDEQVEQTGFERSSLQRRVVLAELAKSTARSCSHCFVLTPIAHGEHRKPANLVEIYNLEAIEL
jgi:hypothetical protein